MQLWFHEVLLLSLGCNAPEYSRGQLILNKSRNPTKNRHFAHFAMKYHDAHKACTSLIISLYVNLFLRFQVNKE
jgi:hypothetical protein